MNKQIGFYRRRDKTSDQLDMFLSQKIKNTLKKQIVFYHKTVETSDQKDGFL